ncbi:hypothetical protein L6452_39211 [Arctium lappa]|uniref:Uncharacterized protein n=1 Tax=Arctium lappa TaxID=4217 RepID=A0ACB8XSU4_ARCLA|nr:hypothetical protein L6452_39211 [Arctium lappa]
MVELWRLECLLSRATNRMVGLGSIHRRLGSVVAMVSTGATLIGPIWKFYGFESFGMFMVVLAWCDGATAATVVRRWCCNGVAVGALGLLRWPMETDSREARDSES